MAIRISDMDPRSNLLIECKQSELPYVFFVREERPAERNDFPEFAGIPTGKIELHHQEPGDEELSGFAYYISAHDILGLYDLPFFRGPGKYAVSISKAVWRKGGKVEPTGEEAFRSLTLPLVTAAEHFKRLNEPDPDSDDWFFRIRLIVCVAVLRAPMLGSTRKDGGHELVPVPWVGSWRLEPKRREQEDRAGAASSYRYMDVVHESFLRQYLYMLVRDFKIVAERLEKLHTVITEGRGVDVMSLRGDGGAESESEPFEQIRGLTPAEKERLDTEADDGPES